MNPRPRSATDGGKPGADAVAATVGERFARALVAKDAGALCALLADPLDFQALTPGRHWQAGTGKQAVEEIILARWFGTGDDITELCSVTAGRVLDREHVAYRVQRRRTADHLDAGPVLGVPVVPGVRSASVPVAGSGISPWLAANRLASARLVVPVLA
jgi:hypothetical protein